MSAQAAISPPATASTRPTAWRLLRANLLASAGLVVFSLVVLLALLAPVLPLANPDATAPAQRLLPLFSEGHWLGTDALGRDLLSRLLWGARVSLAVGISATAIAAVAGSSIGLLAGYAGGRTDGLLMRGIDMIMAFPYILLALAIVAVLGPGLLNALYAIAVVNIPFFARNVRGITLGISRREFIEAARLSGKSHGRILFGEVLPNVMPVIIITMSTTVGWMILETAGLSFLGLGAQPPQADLGSMLGDGRKILFTHPLVSMLPGLAIFLLVMSINLLGDGVRDVLDPRLKSGALSRPVARTAISRKPVSTGAKVGDSAVDTVSGTARDPAPGPAPGAMLDVRALETGFYLGRSLHPAVRGVDITLYPGECLGLVGESGSGKSVSALSIMGLVPTPPGCITGGNAWLDGEDVFAASDERIRALRGAKVAHVFQDPLSTLHPLYSVGDQIIEAIRAHRNVSKRDARAHALELLDQVSIPNPDARLDAYPHELSGGLRQRVCIAMALANDAQVLIADEPTTALDVTVQAQILGLLNTLRQQRDLAILFITHDFGVVSALCDRVAVMYAGQVVEEGSTSDVLDAAAHPYTARLIACVPVLGEPRRRLDAIAGQPPRLDALPTGCAFADRCPRVADDCRAAPVSLTPLGDSSASGNTRREGGAEREGAGEVRRVRCLHPMTEVGNA